MKNYNKQQNNAKQLLDVVVLNIPEETQSQRLFIRLSGFVVPAVYVCDSVTVRVVNSEHKANKALYSQLTGWLSPPPAKAPIVTPPLQQLGQAAFPLTHCEAPNTPANLLSFGRTPNHRSCV